MDGRIVLSGVVKKKSSSGCLIIRRRSENKDIVPVVASGGLKRHSSIASTVWGSSTEDESSEYVRRNVSDNAVDNGSIVCKIETEGCRNYAQLKINGERQRRSRLELFESDEHDALAVENRSKLVEHSDLRELNEFRLGSLCGSSAAEQRKLDSYIGSSTVRSKGVEYGGRPFKGFELEEDEASMPISLLQLNYQKRSDQPIRLQGKNGVLKLLVGKKNKMDLHSQYKNYKPREFEEKNGPKSEGVAKKDILAQLPLFSVSKPPENPSLFIEGNRMADVKRRERKLVKAKPVLYECSKARDPETSGTDTMLKLTPPCVEACISKEGVKKEEPRSPLRNVVPVKREEGKAKRGGNTEKQMVRDKIRKMLIDSGWTIDRRRRRNRDYLDAVYINPRGITYWSIIKAYDAFKKQMGVENGESKSDPSFSSLSEDLINKLTRQTKNKIERERKRKIKEDVMIKCANKSAVRDAAKCSNHDEDKVKDKESEDYVKRSPQTQ
ncbi:hypothetical protein F511_24110 [Dorcoceras hygrometricum]|uniref:DUF7028 domain-containing protein n=1 Tax=Dorcoceras hygrometricum TaxID=472368 RepID=A0A2Z7ADR7_9LAMI|nr:hypothetical protein F511_24110 [Dorcoceras hygrometricum]